MKVKFLTSVAGLNFCYDANCIYDMQVPEALGSIQHGWAVAVDAIASPIPLPEEIRITEKAVSKRKLEKR